MGKPLILLTGASGYVGGRLLPLLEQQGYPVRLLVRHPLSLSSASQVIVGDASDAEALKQALRGVDVAFYFIHSMGSTTDFTEEDRHIAAQFAKIASQEKVRRIIYLGGLGSPQDQLSSHLRSRQEVGEVLRANADGVQVIEFRASIVIGSGSLSYELVRSLTDKLPIMITPTWVWTKAQPIAIHDLLSYLIYAIGIDVPGDPIFEIGGRDQVSYGDLMLEYAKQKGLKRWMIPVPVITPKLSGLWLGLVTPVYARIGRKLVDSLRNETVVHDPLALKVFPVKPVSYKEAISQALQNEGKSVPESRWNDSIASAVISQTTSPSNSMEQLKDKRTIVVPASPEAVFKTIEEIGGDRGYYFGNWLWQIRGGLDLLVGGVGFRRGRRDPSHLRQGEVVDFWRVEEKVPNKLLRLKAEMRLPGRAWLEFKVEPCAEGAIVTQTALFDPSGLFGFLYWYCLFPLHHLVFNGMLKGIKKWTLHSQAPQA